MKRIFIYGDSNIWGDNFSGPRVPYCLRWVNRLQRLEKNRYKIIVNGGCGRVAGEYRLDKAICNGLTAFEADYLRLKPIDLAVIALGTNDLQQRFGRCANDIVISCWFRDG